MKYYFSLLMFLGLLFGCSQQETSEIIKQEDINFVKSLKRATPSATIHTIDSLFLVNENNTSLKALLYFKKGKNLSVLQKDQESIEYFEKALPLFKQLNNAYYIAETHWHIGSAYAFLSKKTEATNHLLKALELNESINNDVLKANIYGSLAHVHYLYDDFINAIEYTNKAISIHLLNHDTLGLSATYNNLAVIYKNINDFDNALKYNEESLLYNKLIDDQSAVAKSYNNLGSVYEKMHDDATAIRYYKLAIEINNSIQNANTSALRNIASLYGRINDLGNSKKYFLQAINIEKKGNKIDIQKNIYSSLLNIASATNNFEEYIYYLEKKDSIIDVQNRNKAQEELKNLENQYLLTTKKIELEQERNVNKTNKIIFGAISILLITFILLMIQYFNNKKLKNEKEKIQLEQKVLRSQMNPHFIFNSLSAIQNSLLDNEPLKSAGYLSRFAKLIRQNFDFINEKSISLKDEIDALKNYLDTQKLRFSDKFDYEIITTPDIDINAVEIPPMLLQPFVENAIEHGFKNKKNKGELTIHISKKKDSVCYEIKDNGKGFDLTTKNRKIHAIDIVKKRLKLLGNNDEKTFNINTSEQGTTINFCLKS